MPEMKLDHINRFTWVFCHLTCMGLCCWDHAQDLPAHVCIHRRLVCRAGDLKGRVTAGAVSAALRELRPVEIVGVYEDTIEGLKVMQQRSQLGKSHASHAKARVSHEYPSDSHKQSAPAAARVKCMAQLLMLNG